jgi:hypothetical protein
MIFEVALIFALILNISPKVVPHMQLNLLSTH